MESANLLQLSIPRAPSYGLLRESKVPRLRPLHFTHKFSELRLRRKDAQQLLLSSKLGLSTFRRSNFSRNAVGEEPLKSDDHAYVANRPFRSFLPFLAAFYRFTRPHTVIGTSLSIVSVSLLAVQNYSDISWQFLSKVFEALAASLLMNVYIVGLNQLSDIDIDKINKPYLPLASGEFSVSTGVILVASSALMSFWISFSVGSWPLFCAIFFSFVLGTAYSINLPNLRWKRSAILAAICIILVRALIVQLFFYMHIQVHVFNQTFALSKPVVFATAFMGFFSIVIALFKDIPDIKGDETYGIRSFTVSFGQKNVFWTCIVLLEIAYAVSIVLGIGSCFYWSKVCTVIGHSVLAMLLWKRANSVDLSSKASITSCYMYIWKLFYAEYFLIPLVR